MELSVAKKYVMRNVPRYTSYPTAPHFDGSVGSKDLENWISQIDPNDPISVYLHVPFCKKLCWYCGCNMKLASRQEPITDYVETLVREIRLVSRYLPGALRVSHLHWGGGTPTALQPDELAYAMDVVRQHFELDSAAELAIESDPRTLSDEMIKRIGKLGFTRASFGVQEFDPCVQKAINRVQPPDMVRRSVEGLRDAGVKSINFDLIYGLPHQTVGKLKDTISICAEMKPDRIALFGYAHVPWMAKKQRLIDESALPNASQRLEQATASASALKHAGYVQVGMDHFALPGDDMAIAFHNGGLKRNFQGYTTDKANTLIALGATSIGKTPFGYYQNIGETGAWKRSIMAGELPVSRGYQFRDDDKLRGAVIEQLMCNGEVDLAMVADRYGKTDNWYVDLVPDLQLFLEEKIVEFDGCKLSITAEGRPLVRVVASLFDSFLQNDKGQHSLAV